MARKKIIIFILMGVYLICAVVLLVLQFLNSPIESELKRTAGSQIHGLLSLSGTICCGIGMIMYRLLDGLRTRIIKYIHLGCQTLAAILLFVGTGFAPGGINVAATVAGGDAAKSAYLHITSQVHLTVGYLLLVAVALQYVIGSFVFYYLYSNNKMRHIVAPFHDIIGIWIFVCLVATYLTGLHFLYDPMGYWMDDVTNSIGDSNLGFICLPAFLGFLIVIVIVVSPYFEWKLVGPI